MKNVYHISNISCAYDSKVVLQIEELQLTKGHLTFVVGSSGTGKSTLIETLGLMRNTIRTNSKSKLDFYTRNDGEIDLSKLWASGKNTEMIDKYRNDYLSFVFQKSFLFENFTVYENIILPSLLKGSNHELDFDSLKRDWLDKFDLSEIKRNHEVAALSQGQKQRVAFIRGLLPNFDVLFGDEPTGNLDPRNTKYLIGRLSNEIKSMKQSAIIVTHNLEMATEFGDSLIILTKRNINQPAKVTSENQFVRESNSWVPINGGQVLSNDQFLKKLHDEI